MGNCPKKIGVCKPKTNDVEESDKPCTVKGLRDDSLRYVVLCPGEARKGRPLVAFSPGCGLGQRRDLGSERRASGIRRGRTAERWFREGRRRSAQARARLRTDRPDAASLGFEPGSQRPDPGPTPVPRTFGTAPGGLGNGAWSPADPNLGIGRASRPATSRSAKAVRRHRGSKPCAIRG